MPTEDYLEPEPPGPIERRFAELARERDEARLSEAALRLKLAAAVADDKPVETVTSRLILERIQNLKDQARTTYAEYLKADGAAYEKRWAELQVLSNQALQVTRTQARIGAWGRSCPAVTARIKGDSVYAPVYEAIRKLGEEIRELAASPLYSEDFDKEIVDCAVVLFRLADLRGIDLLTGIEEKMPEVVAKHGGVWVDREGKEHGK